MNSHTALNAILRTDFKFFYQRSFAELNPAIDYQDNWHMDAIIHVLNGVINGDIRRLIINMPPRYGKSLATTVALTAYLLGLDPSKRIITACYAYSLAEKLSLECRRLMAAPFYCNAFPDLKIGKGKNAVTHFETTAGGFRYATSLGGAITGMGADLLIVDDLMKASMLPSENELDSASDFLQGTLFSRLNDKTNGQIVIVSQRLHEDDPPGRLIAKGGWHVLSLSAIAEHDVDTPVGPFKTYHRKKGEALHPEREPLDVLEQLREDLGPRVFGAQYQQAPIPAGGGVLEWKWFQHYDVLPNRGKGAFIVQCWDTAMVVSNSSSFTVCTTWYCFGNQYYLVDVWRHRRPSSELPRIVHEHAIKFKADRVLIEHTNGSAALIETLRKHSKLWLIWDKPTASKEERMESETPVLAQGRVHVPHNAHWLEAFRAEVIKFPESKHDDQIDSISLFLKWARLRGPDNPGGAPGWGHPGGPIGPAPKNVGASNQPKDFSYYRPAPNLDLSELY
ncbi:MAG: putative phage terminase large subunit-like protein [Porticoccus sp.]|jgi:predicted phage terminase large subunit-like protein|uniref:phage terminase large subunit n=1 Tax=Porticoccus sp. TaxID=2024853 RepID=UPI0039E3D17F